MAGPIVVNAELFTDEKRKEELKQLLQFLQSQLETVAFFEREQQASRSADGESQIFKFDQPVLYKKRQDSAVVVYVLGSAVGTGGAGTVVYDIAKSVELTPALESQQGGSYTQLQPPRVVKVQQKQRADYVQREYEKSQKAEHLGVQEPIVETSGRSFIVMNKLPGRELFNIINDDLQGFRRLTIIERMELSCKILEMIKKQVVDKSIVHYDLKPENIIVDLGPPMQVNIIDYGFASQVGEETRLRGTLAYIPLENYENAFKAADTKTDSFAAGRILQEIWGARDSSYSLQWKPSHALKRQYKHDPIPFLPELDQSVLKLFGSNPSEHVQSSMQGIIMVTQFLQHKTPSERLSIEDALVRMYRIYNAYLQPNKSSKSLVVQPGRFAPASVSVDTPKRRSGVSKAQRHNQQIAQQRKARSGSPMNLKVGPDGLITTVSSSQASAKQQSLSQSESSTASRPSRGRYGLAALGAVVCAGVGVALLFTGVLEPLGLGTLALAVVIAGMAVVGGAAGAGAGSLVDRPPKDGSRPIDSPSSANANPIIAGSWKLICDKLGVGGGETPGDNTVVSRDAVLAASKEPPPPAVKPSSESENTTKESKGPK